MDMFANTPVDFHYMDTLAKTFTVPARQNQFIQENSFNNAPFRRIDFAKVTSSAFTGSKLKSPFCICRYNSSCFVFQKNI